MAEQPVVVQRISWSDLFPWTLIFKTLPVASSMTVLLFALLGVLLCPLGWWLSETVFLTDELREQGSITRIVETNRSPYQVVFAGSPMGRDASGLMGLGLDGPQTVFQNMVAPFRAVFSNSIGLREYFYFLFGGLISVVVWSFSGLAIVRVCLLRLTRNEHEGLGDAFLFARQNWTKALGAIGIPLIAVAVLCIPAVLIGLLMTFDIGVLFAGIIWIAVLGLAILMGLLLFGLMFGWPLMVASVGCEGQNSFDAMTRSYAYTFQRPLNYFFYMTVSVLFGGFCWLIVASLTVGVLDLAWWSTSWGSNVATAERMEIVQGGLVIPADGEVSESGMIKGGRSLIGMWNASLKTLAAAFVYGLFWCMASAIYLLLRKDVDEMEMDEIFIADEKRTFSLPPLRSDEHGIPQVQEPVPDDKCSKGKAAKGQTEEDERPGENSEDGPTTGGQASNGD